MGYRVWVCLAVCCCAILAQDSASLETAKHALEQASTLSAKQDFAQSKAQAQQALEIYERLKGPEDATVARALRSLGEALHGMGDYTAAGPVFERALAIARKALGPGDRATIEILEWVAFNFSRAGDYGKAKVLEEQALALSEAQFGARDPLTGEALRVLGQILVELGDYPTAESYQLRSLGILEAKLGKDAVAVGDTLLTMGNSARDAGFEERGREYFERAVAIYEKQLGPDDTRVGGALDNLAQSLTVLKRYDEARVRFERALRIQTKAIGATHPWTANIIQGLAKAEAGEGHYEKARELLEQNLAIWRERLGPAHPFTMVSTMLLSDVLARLGRRQEAMAMALEAAAIRRENIVFTVRVMDERQALRYADLHAASMDTVLSLAAVPGATPEERSKAWDALIRSRALVLDEMGARRRSLRDSGDPQIPELAQKLAGARAQLAKLVLQGPGREGVADHVQRVERSRAELSQVEEVLALRSAEFRRQIAMRGAGYDDVAGALPSGSVLVAFRRCRLIDFHSPAAEPVESYIAFVLQDPGKPPEIVRLGTAARIDNLVKRWRAEIDRERSSLGRATRTNEASYRAAAAQLRAAVWDPLEKRMSEARRVFIVPDGALQLVNFAALPAPNGRYLEESGPLLHSLSAERDLTEPARTTAGRDMLAVADPRFDADAETRSTRPMFRSAPSKCGDFSALRFGGLPGSRDELHAIAAIWEGRGWTATALNGAAATEAAVKETAPGKRVVHLATHGFFLDPQCSGGAVARENPLLRSGLALAGANHRQSARSDEEDGILTAEEVASLDLDAAEWVVLSGCDTGVGDVRVGEGVLGLRRAFQEAGARTLIASLWPVDDREERTGCRRSTARGSSTNRGRRSRCARPE